MSEKSAIRRRIHRPAASATWEHNHRWGSQLGDSTNLRVARKDGGGMTVSYGRESIEIREELVDIFAEMVAAAAVWSDDETADMPPQKDGADRG